MKRLFTLLLALLCLLTVSCGKKDPPDVDPGRTTDAESEPSETQPDHTEPATEARTDAPTEAPTETVPVDESGYYRHMVVFGDSIAHGYGLDDKLHTRYSALLTDRFSSLPIPLTETNYAVDGATSEDMLNLLNNGVSELKNADLVVISIGANNILRYSYEFLGMFQSGQTESALAIINSPEFLEKINSGIEKLGTDIPKLIGKIRESAPDADIVFQTIYNPYKGARIVFGLNGFEMKVDFGGKINGWVEGLNGKIREGAVKYGYAVAEVHDEFEKNPDRLVNVVLAENGALTAELDPHPDKNGHRVIADVILDTLKTLGKKLPE
ncbi:MAG: SGNH/GDSL hydrolase family protein [Lachnospiraceae bacterium]|nr:SGNH/GDSL hydrolase family protein [Lachnospiraceae bacterium]